MNLQAIQQKMLSQHEKKGVQTADAPIVNLIDCGTGVASIHQSAHGTRPRRREPRRIKGNLKEQPDVSRIDAQ
ncbi:hypothetical protein SAMN02787142_5184 [Burkholderia sp. WP9]|nr:hypothetical protein SAMN02787142_5184 [Burkholderia sp. WP9]